ncbi:MAG TPA: serine hydrolase domain-containing protein [Bacteroidia bacterium]|nr:serine hydrolase domain-containing protein [Bacteroidia bacterium]
MSAFFFLIGLMLLSLAGCQEAAAPVAVSQITLGDTPPPASLPKLPREHWEAFAAGWDSIFTAQLDSTHCPGAAVVIVQDSEVIFQRGYGLRSTHDTATVNAHTLFRIGSLSKGFAGVMASLVASQGKFDFDERVKDILPDFRLSDSAQTERIKVWHLLSHCTGLPRHTFTSRFEWNEDRRAILCDLETVPVIGAEGTVFAYQNFSFSLIEDILQTRTGSTYTDLVEAWILEKAGMNDATVRESEWLIAPNKAFPHSNDRKGNFHPVPLNSKYFLAPSAGGIAASISDMGKWLTVLLGHRPDVASQAVLDSAFRARVETQSRAFAHRWEGALASYYGAGWRIIDLGGQQVICHGGNVNNYRSEMAFDRESGIGVCFLFNAICPRQATAPPDFFRYYQTYMAALQVQ